MLLGEMQAHFNSEPDTLASIVPAFRVSPTASLADGHDAQRLNDCKRMLVRLSIEKPKGLLEKVVAGRVWIMGKFSCFGLSRKSAAQSKQRIDENR